MAIFLSIVLWDGRSLRAGQDLFADDSEGFATYPAHPQRHSAFRLPLCAMASDLKDQHGAGVTFVLWTGV